MSGVSFTDILAARRRIGSAVRRTPLALSDSLSQTCGAPIHLKFEHQQITGAFKLRGATNAILAMDDERRAAGVVAVSTGNHGRGVAHAARIAGARAIVCLSRLVPKNKVEAIEALGAEVRITGASQDEAQAEVDRLVAEEGMTMISPFEDPYVIAGQGTLGLEIVEDLPEVETVLVPLSGGGLISGIARAVKTAKPEARIVGLTMEHGAAMHASLEAGRPVEVEEVPTLADSLGGGIGLDNVHTFSTVRELVDQIVLLSEEEIAEGIRHAYWRERQVIEGAAAVGIAALLTGKVAAEGPTVAVLSGCNIDMDVHRRLISGEMVRAGEAA